MDIQPNSEQAINDDQELAKVLAGVSQQAGTDDSSYTDAPAMPEPALPPMPMPGPAPDPIYDPNNDPTGFTAPAADLSAPHSPTPATDPTLDGIKQDALNELRPLVDKLQVSPEEKFDTYLLLIRSTDDKELIAPAHEAAKAIPDETKRAQALLDIIKEIDFFSNPPQ